MKLCHLRDDSKKYVGSLSERICCPNSVQLVFLLLLLLLFLLFLLLLLPPFLYLLSFQSRPGYQMGVGSLHRTIIHSFIHSWHPIPIAFSDVNLLLLISIELHLVFLHLHSLQVFFFFIIFIFIFTCSQALMEILWNKIQKNLMWCITIRFYFNMYIDDKCIRVEMTGTHWQCFLWEKSKLTWSYNNLKMSACPFPCFSFFRAAALKVLKCIRSNIGVIFPSLPPQRTLTQG